MYNLDQLESIEGLIEDSIERNEDSIRKGNIEIRPIDLEVLERLKYTLSITQTLIDKETTKEVGLTKVREVESKLEETMT